LTIIVIKIVVQDLKRQLEQTRLVYIWELFLSIQQLMARFLTIDIPSTQMILWQKCGSLLLQEQVASLLSSSCIKKS
jgi:hypothetical protein